MAAVRHTLMAEKKNAQNCSYHVIPTVQPGCGERSPLTILYNLFVLSNMIILPEINYLCWPIIIFFSFLILVSYLRKLLVLPSIINLFEEKRLTEIPGELTTTGIPTATALWSMEWNVISYSCAHRYGEMHVCLFMRYIITAPAYIRRHACWYVK